MEIEFYKYQGTGNDFIIIDNRQLLFDKKDTSKIKLLCDRRFGIGADGLILLEDHDGFDFKMVYYNSDGNESSMCGNGGRCITAFAKQLGIIHDSAVFLAIDGSHKSKVKGNLVELQMMDVVEIKKLEDHIFLDTGSPHVVIEKENLEELKIVSVAREIRNSPAYIAKGTNVNFIKQLSDDSFAVRTYERGVEDETLSCGTGVTAVAIAAHKSGKSKKTNISLETKGGLLAVRFKPNAKSYSDVWLSGPATLVFKGSIK